MLPLGGTARSAKGAEMSALLRFVLLVLVSAVALQLAFAARIALMRVIDPQSTTFQRSELRRLAGQNGELQWRQAWRPYERMADSLKRAVITAEDAGFTDHGGVDWEAVEQAWEKNQKAQARVEQAGRITARSASTPAGAELRLVDADRDAGDRLSRRAEHGGAERIDAFAHGFVVDAVAAFLRERELLDEGLDVARALAREARRELTVEAAPDLVGGQLRKHRLAAAGEVGRQAHADVQGQAERPRAVAYGDIERFVARQHRQHHGLLGRGAAVAPERVKFLGDVGAGDKGFGQAHDARADEKRAVRLAPEVAERNQRRAQAVDAALRQRQLARQLRQRHRLAAAREAVEQRQRPRDRRHQRRDRRALGGQRQGIRSSEGHRLSEWAGGDRSSRHEGTGFNLLNRLQRSGRGV